MTTLRVIDIETSGLDPSTAGVVEIASVDFEVKSKQFLAPRSYLVNPGHKIPAIARAIHHISDIDVIDAITIDTAVTRVMLPYPLPAAFVAHNAAFEQSFLARYAQDISWICTWKVSVRLWPELESHANQVLRYALDLEIPENLSYPPHRALPDAVVTAYILQRALELTTIDAMLKWSVEPALLPRCPIGQEWRGKPWSVVDSGFLVWIIQKEGMEADYKWNAQRELDKRTYVSGAKAVLRFCENVLVLNEWFRNEVEAREALGIVPGTVEFTSSVDACAAHKAHLFRHRRTSPKYP